MCNQSQAISILGVESYPNEEIVNDFKKYYPHSQNLEEYIDGQ